MRLLQLSLIVALALTACEVQMAATPASDEFPNDWYFYADERPEALRKLEGQPAPALKVKDWIGEPKTLEDLKGKIVVIDFWGTWCPPCMRALPKNVKLQEEHKESGVVFLGVHDSTRGSDKMAAVAKDQKINYPLSVDDGGASAKAYKVSFWPTYVVLDRKGVVRAAGLTPESVDKVLEKLLKEKPEPAPRSP